MPETLPHEMKGLQSIVDQAKDFDIAVYRELKKSQALVEQKFYTEAALRLGRAVEAFNGFASNAAFHLAEVIFRKHFVL